MDTTAFQFKDFETALAALGITDNSEESTLPDSGGDETTVLQLPKLNTNTGTPPPARYTKSELRNIVESDTYFKDCELNRVELHNCLVEGSKVTNAILVDCTLFNCELFNTKARQSQLTCCIVSKGLRNTTDSPYLFCRLNDCGIESTEISGALITGGFLEYCLNIQNSEIHRAIVYTCDLLHSTVAHSGLYKTKVYECKLSKNISKDSEITTSPLTLRKFPTEIRQIIFRNTFEFAGRYTPDLIVALRGEPKLYFEALEVLGKTCFFEISTRNDKTRPSMGEEAYKSIRKLSLW
jgi:uncharacterized protein YjbI with pentapeptide repeats